MAEQAQIQPPRKSVFISYAHKDNDENFVARLGWALSMYIDTFWDEKLGAGSWERQLISKAVECDIFLVIMSPWQKEGSEWCKKELAIAEENHKTIIPIKRFRDHEDKKLELLQQADFSTDFERGFGKLTYYVFQKSFVSWEGLVNYDTLSILPHGIIPTPILKDFSQWLVVELLWPSLLAEIKNDYIAVPKPQTLLGVIQSLEYIREQLPNVRNFSAIHWTDQAISIVKGYVENDNRLSSNERKEISVNVSKLYENTTQYIEAILATKRDFDALAKLRATHKFHVASKLHELINVHADRIRHPYPSE